MKKFLTFIISFSLVLGTFGICNADTALEKSARYIYENTPNPTVSSIGGEWAIIGLSRSGFEISEKYCEKYVSNVEEYLKEHGGILHDKKYTEYSRVILALTSIGRNPADIGGYNLLEPLGDYEKTVWQGTNGAIWALIALDCGDYAVPKNPSAKTQATREMYIERILSLQNPDGGWPLSEGAASDTDITAMALTSLSGYTNRSDVSEAIEQALGYLSAVQNEDGGFSSRGAENSESCAQVIVALCSLGTGVDDPRFTKNGKTVLDAILQYRNSDGTFLHTADGSGVNRMSTEQGVYALAAMSRFQNGQNPLFDMSDVEKSGSAQNPDESFGLPNKDPNVKRREISEQKSFSDTGGIPEQKQIEELASRGIINGRGDGRFSPADTMTRAEFASIIANGLGLEAEVKINFSDVREKDWFFRPITAAYGYKIIFGVSDTQFNPYGTITKEEAAAMLSRAAKLCGIGTEITSDSVRDTLAVFPDYKTVGSWAETPLAVCIKEGIILDGTSELEPKKQVTRAEIAVMVFNLLDISKLL